MHSIETYFSELDKSGIERPNPAYLTKNATEFDDKCAVAAVVGLAKELQGQTTAKDSLHVSHLNRVNPATPKKAPKKTGRKKGVKTGGSNVKAAYPSGAWVVFGSTVEGRQWMQLFRNGGYEISFWFRQLQGGGAITVPELSAVMWTAESYLSWRMGQ